MKVLTISDSFKGSLSSKEVGQIVTEYLTNQKIEAKYLPISDGGEGFLDVISHLTSLKPLSFKVSDANFNETVAHYLYDEKTKTAYLELAEASGITKIKELKPLLASTYGLGELIKKVLKKHHPQKIVLGIGGSATSDLGCGMLEALGVEFFDEKGFIIKKMNNLKLMQVRKVNLGAFKRLIKKTQFITLTDVTNPLLGKNGTIPIFAPQKGAKEEELPLMQQNIFHLYKVLHQKLAKKINLKDFPSAGAAGGVGFTMRYLFNSAISSGIEEILKMVSFEDLVKEYDIIITGEGSFDEQSLNGKVISGIKKYEPKRLIIICGSTKFTSDLTDVYPVVPTVATLEESLANPKECLLKLLEKIKEKLN